MRLLLATTLLLAVTGCDRVDEARLIRELEACPKAAALLGTPIKVAWVRSEVKVVDGWEPPVEACTHKAYLKGAIDSAVVYFTPEFGEPCFHVTKYNVRVFSAADCAAR